LSLAQKVNHSSVASVMVPKKRCHIRSLPSPDAGEA